MPTITLGTFEHAPPPGFGPWIEYKGGGMPGWLDPGDNVSIVIASEVRSPLSYVDGQSDAASLGWGEAEGNSTIALFAVEVDHAIYYAPPIDFQSIDTSPMEGNPLFGLF